MMHGMMRTEKIGPRLESSGARRLCAVTLRIGAILSLGLLAACGGDELVADPDTERVIEQGSIVGASMRDGRVDVWRGLPFAQPPVGPLRWRAPSEPAAWQGVRESVESGSPCAQLGGDPILGNEDCLYLDVFAPVTARAGVEDASRRIPVMFWIHGGGNAMGAGDQLDASRLAAENDVIVVTINYRLGIFGWMSHPALRASAEGPDDASGNFGTLDMIRALEWVRSNVGQFGGDANNVTIFGESAGGLNVFSLLLSPRAKGLFHGAIAESGVPVSMTRAQAERYTDDEGEEGLPGSSGELLLNLLFAEGRASTRPEAKRVAAEMSPSETESFLRGFSTEELLAPFVAAAEGSAMPIYISPNILRDGHVVLDRDPLDALSTPGGYNAVPFMAGSNREESKLFFLMTSPHVSRTFGIPTGLNDERRYDLEGEYGGLVWRAQGVDEPLDRMRAVQGPSVWGYRFDWDEEPSVMGVDLSKLLGAAHGIELIFVFGLTDLGFGNRFLFEDPDSADRLSSRMRSYWAEFAHTKNPGRGQAGDLARWQPWGSEPGADRYIIFDTVPDGQFEFGTDVVDQAEVLRRVAEDPRLESTEERCVIYRNMVQWSSALTPEEYQEIDSGRCAAYPLDGRIYFASLSAENGPPAE